MIDPLLSLVYLTYRPGGIDLLAEGLALQEPCYELIVVDDCDGRVQRGQAEAYLRVRGINLQWYGESKIRSLNTLHGLANGMNTTCFLAINLFGTLHKMLFG